MYEKLKHTIPSKKISKFVSQAISIELEKKEKELVLAYEAAEQNADRQEILNEWDLIDDFSKK